MLPNWMWISRDKEVGGFFNSYMYYEFIKYEVTNHFIIDSRLKCAILREIRSRSF